MDHYYRKWTFYCGPLILWTFNIGNEDFLVVSTVESRCFGTHAERSDIFRSEIHFMTKILLTNSRMARRIPMKCLCFNCDVERVQVLDRDNGDIEMTDKYGFTRLMVACKKGSVGAAKHLIQSGVNINRKAYNGITAFDVCVIYSELECMKLLVENGAEVNLTSYAMKHFQKKMYPSWQIPIDYLISLPSCPRAVTIQALELLGAACTDDQSYHHLARGYWLKSLGERAKAEPRDLVQPKSQETHSVYGNTGEFQTVEELNTIASCEEDMWMQALIVRERILGSTDVLMYSYIQHRAIAYLSSGNFDKCIELVSHIISKPREDLRFVEFCEVFNVLCEVMKKHWPVLEDRLNVFIKSIDVMAVVLHPIRVSIVEYKYHFYNKFLKMAVLYIDCLVQAQSSMCEEESKKFNQSVCKLMKTNRCADLFHKLLHIYFRCCDLSQLYDFLNVLLKAGADPQAVDEEGSTPLHVIAERIHPDKHRIIKLLLSNCCACVFNVRNAKMKLFTDYLIPRETVADMKKAFDSCQLQCLAANVLIKYKINYKSVLPNIVVNFVKMHSSCADVYRCY